MESTFSEDLASAQPTPGGGGASAYCGALAAALSSMVGNLTLGKPKYAAVENQIQASLSRLEVLRVRLLELVDEDACAFAPLAAAYGMPQATEEEKAAKQAVMQQALKGACEVPLSIMEACVAVLRECDIMAHEGSRMAVSDAGASAVIAQAATSAASLNIFINTASIDDVEIRESYNKRAESLLDKAHAKGQALFDYVMGEIRQ